MFEVHLAVSGVDVSILYLIGLGLGVGLLSGLLGVGGGWLITPALNILGIPMTYAVGTGLAQMMGTSFTGLMKHRKHGNTDLTLGMIIGFPMIIGVQLGKYILLYLEQLGNAGLVTRAMYFVLLMYMAISIFRRLYFQKETAEEKAIRKTNIFLRPFFAGPKLKLKHEDLETYWLFLVSIGIVAGVFSGIMGVGGGFLLMPVMAYVIGVPPLIAIATSLVCVFIASVSGTITFALSERVDWMAAGLVFSGSFVGTLVGVATTKYIDAQKLQVLFAVLIVIAAVSIALKQMGLDLAASVAIFGSTALLCIISLTYLIRGMIDSTK